MCSTYTKSFSSFGAQQFILWIKTVSSSVSIFAETDDLVGPTCHSLLHGQPYPFFSEASCTQRIHSLFRSFSSTEAAHHFSPSPGHHRASPAKSSSPAAPQERSQAHPAAHSFFPAPQLAQSKLFPATMTVGLSLTLRRNSSNSVSLFPSIHV